MIARLNRLLMAAVVPVTLAACANPEIAAAKQTAAVPLGIDLGGSGPVIPTPQPLPMQAALVGASEMGHAPSTAMELAHEGHDDAHGTATVNSVDPLRHKVNLSHQPIPEIGWPAMTMDFAVAPNVDLRSITPGSRVNFTIERGQGGMYEIQAISPAGARK